MECRVSRKMPFRAIINSSSRTEVLDELGAARPPLPVTGKTMDICASWKGAWTASSPRPRLPVEPPRHRCGTFKAGLRSNSPRQ